MHSVRPRRHGYHLLHRPHLRPLERSAPRTHPEAATEWALIISEPCPVSQLKVGDEVSFVYMNPNRHEHSRVGIVDGFVGSVANPFQTVRLWDYSLADRPNFRSYRTSHIFNLAKLVEIKTTAEKMDTFSRLRQGITQYVRRLVIGR